MWLAIWKDPQTGEFHLLFPGSVPPVGQVWINQGQVFLQMSVTAEQMAEQDLPA